MPAIEFTRDNFNFAALFDHGIACLTIQGEDDPEPVRYASIFYACETFADAMALNDDQPVLSLIEYAVPENSELHLYDRDLYVKDLRNLTWDGKRFFVTPDGSLKIEVFIQLRASLVHALLPW